MNDALKVQVRARAQGRCEYCRMPESADFLEFELDHIIAQKHRGPTVAENLAFACFHCNSQKGPIIAGYDLATKRVVRLFHPRKDRWKAHLAWDGPRMTARTSIGRVTIHVLNTNESELIDIREMMIDEGLLP